MPRDGSGVYTRPPGTDGVPDTTIESTKYNSFVADIQTDLNAVRPIIAGGTGATNALVARDQLDVEVAGQAVTNYDSHVWENGSFYSLAGATGEPVASGYVSGICHKINDTSIILEAAVYTQTGGPPTQYVREKWTTWGAWKLAGDDRFVNVTGDTMTGDLTIAKSNAAFTLASTNISEQALLYLKAGGLAKFFTAIQGGTGDYLIGRFNDAGAFQDVPFSINRSTGRVGIIADPQFPLEVAPKQYVDAKAAAATAALIPPGSSMLFMQASAPTGWTQATAITDRVIRMVNTAGGGIGGTLPFSSMFAYRNTDGFTLSTNEMPPHRHQILSQPNGGAVQDSILVQNQAANYVETGGIYGNAYILNAGGGAAHVHSLDARVQYVDAIIAVKN